MSVSTNPSSSRRILLICNSRIGQRMSGPGVRYSEFARVLGQRPGFDVTLVTVPGIAAEPITVGEPFRVRSGHAESDLRVWADAASVVIAPGAVVSLYPSLRRIKSFLVLDLYIPLLLEELQRVWPNSPAEQALHFERLRREMAAQIRFADFILCASEKQRDYWLGAMSALGRVNPFSHADDPTLRRSIAVVPFGLPSVPPRHTRQVLKGVLPGIGRHDKVILWGGGIWDWLDAPTLIRAMVRIAERRPDAKLFFMGARHSLAQAYERGAVQETIQLSHELGLIDRTVFFNDWVPYAERESYLLEADLGVSLHRDHLEARFSFRTRFLDNLWTGLPIIATRGDVLSEQVEAQGLGRVVEPGDVEGVAEAIVSLLDVPNLRETYRARFERVAALYHWEVVTRPLVEFCAAPRLAPDKPYLRESSALDASWTPAWRLPGRAWRALRAGGVRGLSHQVSEYWRWQLNRRGR